ncbi:DUF3426 domain-containing protein [Paraburkholderia tropica]|uniref:Zn finger-like uncharacterized protein n=1 Tax=Paraburkholderia tropica TaxID=92647 RepID=A0ABX5MJ17_9BURK|nr:DUF3426 domain-containing protein [Paraburkholderia tropica]MBB2982911.1 putative Zn finger-like uncharacterized protein [Paraburkholderia tropica]MDE1143479.1 DUF3426 domain-containing protein [Paraburkholderia tropica]OBR51282.1 hypothetical protein A6456_30925 [Paraburkholderia tropica]PXX06774.1 putative Zn finger-like uncharacterized protein [Paraburkholderia tropica]PZW72439.1 putative Zn finger-like uncharacterized protein [Paraburkholderia tropica]
MLLATRCPFCETVFRIQPAHLAARRGLVRCGHCQEAFDASGSLYEVPENGDFSQAVPVAADIAASLASPGSAQAAAAVAAAGSQTASQPTSPAASQSAHQAPAPVSEPAPHVQHDQPHPQEWTQTDASAANFAAQDAAAQPAPDFANPGWNPWAPRPDSRIDPNLQYTAQNLPRPGIAPGATLGVTPGVELKHASESSEPSLAREFAPEQPAQPASTSAPTPAPTPDTAEPFPPATRWTRVEPGLAASAPAAAAATGEPVEPSLASRTPAAAAPFAADPEPSLSARAEPAGAAAAPAFSALEPRDGSEPFAVTREAPAHPPRRIGWRIVGALVALLLLVGLAAQLLWWQRESVMVYFPASQPLYQQACAQLGCRISPPRDIDGLEVQQSDLRQVDDPHHLELKVPLRNRFGIALAYPALELTLLDRQNNVVLRRVLWPQDYAAPGTRIEAGLPAHSTQTMIVRLDTGNVVASNFRIEIFYP